MSVVNAENPEIEDDNVYSIQEDIKENYKKTLYQTITWQSLVFVIYGVVLVVHRKEFLLLRIASPNSFWFIGANLALYLAGVIFGIIALALSNYYEYMIKAGYWFTGILLCFTFYGVYVANEMYDLQNKNHKFKDLYNLMIWMICIRLFIYGMICSFMACFSVFVCCAIASGQANLINSEHQDQQFDFQASSKRVKRFLK